MGKEEIIKGILKRFKMDSKAVRNMEDYEYELVYHSFSEIPIETIDAAIESYKNREFQVKVVISKFK